MNWTEWLDWPPRWSVWAAIAGLTAVVVFTRAGFLLLPERLQPTERAERWLRYAPLAAIAGVIAPEMLGAFFPAQAAPWPVWPGWRGMLADARLPAGVVMVLVGTWRKDAFLALVAGIVTFLALRALAS